MENRNNEESRYYDKLVAKINKVLASDFTDYALARYVGDSSSNNIGDLRKGSSKVINMRMEKARKLENFYEENKEAIERSIQGREEGEE